MFTEINPLNKLSFHTLVLKWGGKCGTNPYSVPSVQTSFHASPLGEQTKPMQNESLTKNRNLLYFFLDIHFVSLLHVSTE